MTSIILTEAEAALIVETDLLQTFPDGTELSGLVLRLPPLPAEDRESMVREGLPALKLAVRIFEQLI